MCVCVHACASVCERERVCVCVSMSVCERECMFVHVRIQLVKIQAWDSNSALPWCNASFT